MVGLSRSLGERTVGSRATSSLASGGGLTPSSSQAGIQLDLFGAEAAPASLLVSPGKILDSPLHSQMIDTSGLLGTDLLKSANLQLSLENRLQANLDANGSLESDLTWKRWDMWQGRHAMPMICPPTSLHPCLPCSHFILLPFSSNLGRVVRIMA